MKTAVVTLSSVSPLSQSRFHDTPKLDKERADAYEGRTWRNRLHVNDSGNVIIPPMSLKNALSEVARYLAIQIPGKGKATFTKHFEAGLLVMEEIDTGVKAKDAKGEWLFVPADGKRGSGKRVKKCFPVIPKWTGVAEVVIMDDTITEAVLKHHLEQAGNFIGMGRFRPRNNGFYGRFKVESINWK